MCETQDPVSLKRDSRALCRISIVNAENPTQVLLDTLVKPSWPVVDYRTWVNGISKEHLDNVEFTLRHAQAFMLALCSEETVIIGHALQNDLAAIHMEHQCVVDSALLYRVKDAPEATPSLKDLASSVMGQTMPDTHDSVNDARAALACLEHYVEKQGKVEPVVKLMPLTRKHYAEQLFVHRIPNFMEPDHLIRMFSAHTHVLPSRVEDIEFTSDLGKTHVFFESQRHADLAFDTLAGTAEPDKSGRLQKKVYLRSW